MSAPYHIHRPPNAQGALGPSPDPPDAIGEQPSAGRRWSARLNSLVGTAREPSQRPWRYAVAAALVLVAVLARLALDAVLPPAGFPFLTFFPAVVLTALYGGLGPGLLSVLLSTAAANWLFIPPYNVLLPASWQEGLAVGFFSGVELLEVAVIEAMHRALARARKAHSRSESLASALREGEATLSAVLDALPVGVIIADPQGRIVRDNAASRALWGLPPGMMSYEGNKDWAGWRPDTGQPIKADEWAMARALLHGEVTTGELVECQPFGSEERRSYLTSAAPVRDAAGHIIAGVVAELDVTEARRREQVLQELVATLDLATAFVRDVDGTVRFWSAGCERLYGWTAQEATGRNSNEFLGTASVSLRQTIEAALERDGSWVGDLQHRTRDGRELVVAVRKAQRRDAEGRAGAVVEVVTDVTAARAAEAALAQTNEAARAAAERVQLALAAGAIVGTWDWDLQTDRFKVDERFADAFGLDPALGRHGLTLDQVIATVHQGDLPGLRVAIAAAIERGGAYSHEYRVRRRDGAYRWIEANGRVDHAEDGTPARFPGVLLDIEGRRVLEAERDQAATLLRTFVETVPGVIYAKDRQGHMLIANAGTAALIGKEPREFLGRTDAEFLDDKAQAETIMANDRRVMEAGVPQQVEEMLTLADGTLTTWLSTKVPLRDGSGEVVGLVGTSVDISTRKAAEVVLTRNKAELEHLIDERTRDLQLTQQRLAHAQRMEALGQLAGGIAHDFNNVLQSVQGGAALIQKRAPAQGDIRRLARMMAEAATRGSAVTRRLLAFSRRGELRAEPADATALLMGMREIFGHTLGAGISVQVRTEPDLPMLLADKGQLETVLVNLATNARDAMPEGGVLTLEASLDIVTLDIGLSPSEQRLGAAKLKPGGYVRLGVSDTGTGMTADVLRRVTEPFFTTKPQGKGTGLGLAMAAGFAEQSGGGLAIDSALQHGTTVTLWFPVAARTQPAALPAKKPAGRSAEGPRARILMVDDNALVLGITAEQLGAEGYDVMSADSGAAAMALLDTGDHVDVLVTDLSMPGMDGLTVIREAQRRRQGLPAILVTGFVHDAAELAIGRTLSGSFLLLRKPVSVQQLTEHVEILLHRPAPI